LLTAAASGALAWWVLDLAAVSQALSLSRFFCLVFCVLGIERVMSGVIDFVTIALTPIETLKQRH
jgi:hypothetical protein